ncbi:AfsR/SARP family transcriptional regulator [Actinacidiphila bryophytorum]|uniref:Regulatory protein AfsR n=1 Tax=Actinacidiphila bryophytorum TaxID=1436133 RepID=A0A9W4MGF3_9ACTN|nr:BTAD domain-containing putative transcriptional regulator [Actinacidiphila bryophytorum]MBM9439389.1 tetratricopeptide repeat protein [Actinacidiphila bryophytorum]MBN6545036.1 tetratricopeptide repeat protein [Actinacidiphila bryophytorum]CAG7638775.1 Regulatory protein AfsR [Actinacidiphila bryophytorum]
MGSGTEPGGGLRFAVLGPVRAWRDDQPIATGAPQQRALLAVLLLRGGRTATAPELLDALWGETPPNTALAALRSYAFRLRKALGSGTLVTDSGGYSIQIPVEALDSTRVEQLAAEAEKVRQSDPAQARDLMVSALDLWKGEPLAGLPGPFAETQRVRLAEWHLGLIEARLELDLETGAHAEAVSELTAITAEHPLRERLRALLMLALYRSGRQAEALGVYADTRRMLADELGIDPSAELSELHQRILEADSGLAPPQGTLAPGAPDILRPAQLPATVPDFTGRAAFVRELSEQLSAATTGSGVMAVSAVAGIGGVGKTTLAVQVAHAGRECFPDGQLYVDLQGTGPRPAEPEAVLGSFLRALGLPDAAIPESLADRAALYRSTLDGRRVLALLDNAYDAAQIRQLLPGTPGCAALVTSRVRMVDLAGAHLVDLDVMSPEESLLLFTRIVGEERVNSERQAALDVVAACGFLPLAIRIAAARLAARRTWTVSVLANKLADHRRRLDELRAGDLAVKATFALGYGHLSAAQARAFRLLSLPEGPDISLDAAAAVLDLDRYRTEELLEALVDISLIESAAPARYRFHDLLRLYARERAEADESTEDRCAALSRLLDFSLASAVSAYALENPGDRVIDHLAPTTHPGLSFAAREDSLEWLFSEAQGLLATVQQAADGGCESFLRRAVDVLLAGQDLVESGVYSRQFEQAARALVTAAEDCGDALVEGRGRVWLGQLLRLSGRFEAAEEEAKRALLLGLAAEDPVASSYAPNLRGSLAHTGHRFAESAAYHTTALDAFRADGNKHGEVSALSNLARAQQDLGDTEAATATAERVVAIHRELGAGFRLGNGLYTMGVTLTAAGRFDEALDCLIEALGIFRAARQQFWEGMTLFRLAQLHLAAQRWRQSAAHIEQSLVIMREIGGEWRTANALTVLGRALDGMGQQIRAHACWQDALAIFSSLGSPEAADVRRLLGDEDQDEPRSTVAV